MLLFKIKGIGTNEEEKYHYCFVVLSKWFSMQCGWMIVHFAVSSFRQSHFKLLWVDFLFTIGVEKNGFKTCKEWPRTVTLHGLA